MENFVYLYLLIPIAWFLLTIIKKPLLILISPYYRKYYKALKLYEYREFTNAAKEMEEAILINSKDWKAYSNLGLFYTMLGKNKQAIMNEHKSISLRKTESPNDLIILALLYAEERMAFEKSIGFINKAQLILQKEHRRIWDVYKGIVYITFAWIYYKNGKKKEMNKYFNMALKSISLLLKKNRNFEYRISFSPFFYHFGIILKHKGEYEKALEYFKKSKKAGGPESIFSKRSEEEIRKIVNGEL